MDLADVFYQLGWSGLLSYMCLDLLVHAEDFAVTEVFDEVSGEWRSVRP